MSETRNLSSVWNVLSKSYYSTLASPAEIKRWELHSPQFLTPSLVGNEFRIGVSEELKRDWFTQLYAKPLEETIGKIGLGEGIHVVFEVVKKEEIKKKVEVPRIQPAPSVPDKPAAKGAAVRRARTLPSTLPLLENYTFENFVRGPSNSFAHAAATAVAKGLGRTDYNPLFIWGGTGLGKTHLMEAIGHYVMKNNPEASVCYITSEAFLNEYVNALASATQPAFRARYRKYDLLLIDDVQFIVGKKNFQEEFFNTISSLLIYNKQIVMTCDQAPKELQGGLEDRLISRFQQGMVVEIESPSYETRLAILKSKMQARHRLIDDEILMYIADNIRSHVRAIEGALSRVTTFIDVNPDTPLTVDVAKYLLKDMIEEEVTIKNITPEAIISAVAEHYGLSVKDLKAPGRQQALVQPRQVAMFLACKLTTDSLLSIGKAFERKHTTVFYGSQQIQTRLSVEQDLKNEIAQLVTKLGRQVSDVLE